MHPGLSEATALDAADPLRGMRELFHLPDDVLYLDGNSLGPPPKAAFAELEKAARHEWGEGLIRSWNAAGWFTLTDTLGDRVGRLIGAEPGETVVTDTTSINIYKALHAALGLRPDRTVILAEADSFPTDLYIAEGVAAARAGVSAASRAALAPRSDSLIDEQTAVVLINHVDYRTGALRDMAGLTAQAHARGALVIWDLCHSAGALPIALDAAEADFAIGCTYKYLNGGPGAPAFIFAARRHHERPGPAALRLVGPCAAVRHGERLIVRPAGIRRLLCGTQPILSLQRPEGGTRRVRCGGSCVDPRQEPGVDRSVHGSRRAPRRGVRGTDHHAARRRPRGSHVAITMSTPMRSSRH